MPRARIGGRRRCWYLLSLLAFLPGFFQIPPVDRDEAYFAQATKQMIETGDYVDIRYQDDVRYRKAGRHLLAAGGGGEDGERARPAQRGRTTIWLYRVPSLLGAIGAVLATYWCALAFVSRRGAVLVGLDDGVARPSSASKRASPRPTPCCCSPSSPPWASLARVYLCAAAGGEPRPAIRLALAGYSGRRSPSAF